MDSRAELAFEGLDLLDIGVGLFDADQRLARCNPAFRALRAYPDDLCKPGASLRDLLRHSAVRGDFGDGDPDRLTAERLAEIAVADDREVEREMADGQVLEIRYRRTSSGGLMVTYRDRTDEARAVAALRRSEERYALISDAAEEAIYEWEIAAGRFYASERLKALLGRGVAADGSRDWAWEDLIHPEDRRRYAAALDAHLSGAAPRWACEYRLRDADGAWRWVSDHGVSVRDEDGRAIRMVAALRDITGERGQAEALARSEERLSLVIDAASDGIFDWSVAVDELYISDRLAALVDIDLSDPTSMKWLNAVHPDDRARYVAGVRDHFRGDVMVMEHDYRVRAKTGEHIWVHERALGRRDENGRVTRYLGAITDITEIHRARAALESSRGRLDSALGALSDGILLIDADNRVEMFNDRYVEIFTEACGKDMTAEITVGRDFFDMIRFGYDAGMFIPHPGGVEAWMEERRQGFETLAHQMEMPLANGMWLLRNERPMPDGGRIAIYTDITEFKRRETEANEARQRFEEAIESIASGFALWDAEDRLVVSNSKYREYFSHLADRAVPGAQFADLIRAAVDRGQFPQSAGREEEFVNRILAVRSEANGEPREQLINGVWLQITDHRTVDGGIVSIYTDITELKIRQEEAQAARQRFEDAIESISTGFALWDAEDRLVLWNTRFKEYFAEVSDIFRPGLAYEALVGESVERGIFPGSKEDPEGYWAMMKAARARVDGQPRERLLADGRWLQITDHRTSEGGIASVYSDITELKQRQEEVERQSAILELTLENMGQGITLVDKDLKTIALNQQFLELMELPPELFERGFTMEQAFRYNAERGEYGPGDIEAQVRERVELSAKFLPHRFERERPDGRVIEIVGNPIEGGGMVATYTDVTERKRAEEALNRALEETKVVLDNIDYGVFLLGPDLRFRLMNKVQQELWGFSDELVTNKPTMREMVQYVRDTLDVYDVAEEDWQDWLDARIEAVEKGGAPAAEIHRTDGIVLLYRCFDLPDGGRMLTYFDITELKKKETESIEARERAEAALADLKRAQERLVQAEKMASLGQLTAGIAHEIKNPLNFVNNFAKLSNELLEELGDLIEEPMKALEQDDREDAEDIFQTVTENLTKIAEHGKRADSIVKNMLLHSREGPSELQRVALNPIAEEALNLAYHGARAENPNFNVEMVTEIDPEAGEVDCYPQDLMRVFLNLITNGMYAANKRRAEAGDGFMPTLTLTTRRADGAVEVAVRDNGVGIPAEVKEKIFLPFFTTKPAGEGTGLGLSLSYDIVVAQHGGSFAVDSKPGDHTTFTVTIPAVARQAGKR